MGFIWSICTEIKFKVMIISGDIKSQKTHAAIKEAVGVCIFVKYCES